MNLRSRSYRRLNCFWCFILVLQLPAVWYSIHTPFTMVDDPGLPEIVETFSTGESFIAWVQRIFIDHSALRFRPTFDLYNYVSWTVFGFNAGLHHMLRLVLKLAITVASLKTLRLILARGAAWRTGALVFLSVFLFYPNCPEARLGPQELLIVCALSFNLYLFFKMSLQDSFPNRVLSRDYLLFALSFILMLGSKESVLLLGFWLFGFYCIRIKHWKKVLRLLPLLILLGYASYAVYRFSRVEGYGRTELTGTWLVDNLRWYAKTIFLTGSSQPLKNINMLLPVFVVSAIFAFGSRIFSIRNKMQDAGWPARVRHIFNDRFFLATGLCLGGFAVSFLSTAPSPFKTLRYAYPAAYLMIMALALNLGNIARQLDTSRRVGPELGSRRFCRGFEVGFHIMVVSFCLFYIAAVYHSFLSQYLVQYRNARYYEKIVERVSSRLAEGYAIHLMNVRWYSEVERRIARKLQDRYPEYRESVKLISNSRPEDSDARMAGGRPVCYLRRFSRSVDIWNLPQNSNWTNVEIVCDEYSHLVREDSFSPWFLKFASLVSSVLQRAERPLEVMYDLGASPDKLVVLYELGPG